MSSAFCMLIWNVFYGFCLTQGGICGKIQFSEITLGVDNIMSAESNKRYYRKHVDFFRLLEKIKLWPSRNGTLHGIRSITYKGEFAEITTHCGKTFMVRNSKNCRAARWIRNKWMRGTCKKCKIPDWKLEKYSKTVFSERYGSELKDVHSK